MDQAVVVPGIRAASRELVRQWGFLGNTVAGSHLSASAAHAVLEVGRNDGLSARDLAAKLRLEKSTVSRLVKSLVERGELREAPNRSDGRAKHLHLTHQGTSTLAGIDRVAEAQVVRALDKLDDAAQLQVLKGLTDYAAALGQVAGSSPDAALRVEIRHGYTPGLVGRIAELSSQRILKLFPLDRRFECKVATDLAEFMTRADRRRNGIWYAVANDRVVGGIAIDGDHLGDDIAQLRWFILSESASGAGLGKQLLSKALDHCDQQGFREIHLWTLKGLDAARSLYDRTGFELVDEYEGDQWGVTATEQKMVRRLPGS